MLRIPWSGRQLHLSDHDTVVVRPGSKKLVRRLLVESEDRGCPALCEGFQESKDLLGAGKWDRVGHLRFFPSNERRLGDDHDQPRFSSITLKNYGYEQRS